MKVFDWTGVSPIGQFAQVAASPLPTRYVWDTSALYTLGSVELTLAAGGAVNGQWAATGIAGWSASGNWAGGNVPGAPQDTAVFAALSGSTALVNLDIPVSLAALAFSTSAGASYAIGSSSGMAITLANTAGAATIDNSGSNMIAVPITLQSNLSVDSSPGSMLTIAGAIGESGSSYSLTLSGGGQLVLSGSNSYSGGTTVLGGTLVLPNPYSLADRSNLIVGNAGAFSATATVGASQDSSGLSDSPSPVPEPAGFILAIGGLITLLLFSGWGQSAGAWCVPRSR
jgi:autotransporter-associated beta strand protein